MKPRVRADVTRGEYTWTMVAVFLIGTIFGWGALGLHPFPSSALEDSSIADVFAALGTWIVGVMAWRISQQSLSHNVQLNQDSTKRGEREEAACLRRLHYEVRRMYAATGAVLKVLDDDAYNKSAEYLALSVEIGDKIIGEIDWPVDAVPLLVEYDVEQLQMLQSMHTKWRVYSEIFIQRMKDLKNDDKLSEDNLAMVGFQRERTEELSKLAKGFRERIEMLLA